MSKFKLVISCGVSLVLAMSALLLAAGSVSTAKATAYFVSATGSDTFGNGTEIWVDADESGDWTTGDSGPWLTIQHAIDTASANREISVDNGTYPHFTVSKNMTIVAPKGPEVTKIIVDTSNWIWINTSCNVTLSGFDIDGSAPAAVNINTVVAGCSVTIQNCVINKNAADGISIFAVNENGSVAIRNCIIAENTGSGIKINGDVTGDVSIENNTIGAISNDTWTFTGNGANGVLVNRIRDTGSIYLDNNTISGNTLDGINVGEVRDSSETLSITNNTISENDAAVELPAVISSSVIFENNTLSDNAYGLYLTAVDAGSSVNITGNSFTGNTNHGLYNHTGSTSVNASGNWWGNPAGPYHTVSNPSTWGDRVSDNVVYAPWNDAASAGSPRTVNIRNTTQSTTGLSIREAITNAAPGDTLQIMSGTYRNFDIDRDLTVESELGPTVTKLRDTGDYVVSINGTFSVVLDGFDIDFSTETNGVLITGVAPGKTVHIKNNVINKNGNNGVYVNDAVSGTLNLTNNIIAQNTRNGLHIDATVNGTVLVQNNTIGISTDTTWTFTGNTENGININTITDASSQVTIDSNVINGNGYHGIRVGSVAEDGNLTVSNNTINANTQSGMSLSSIGQTLFTVNILGNTINDNGDYGINVSEVYESTLNITDNPSISDNLDSGIFILRISKSTVNITGTVTGNTSSQLIFGNGDTVEEANILIVMVSDDSTLTINGNKIASGKGHGIKLSGINVSRKTVNITGNIVIDNAVHGIFVDTISESTLHIDDNPDISNNGSEGINILSIESSTVTIDDNPKIAKNTGTAIHLTTILGQSDVTVNNNTVFENGNRGIHVEAVDLDSDLTVEDNEVRDNLAGIVVSNIRKAPKTVTIRNNVISGHADLTLGHGLMISNVEDSTLNVIGNTLRDNRLGFYLTGVTDNYTITVSGNEFLNSTVYGMLSDGPDDIVAANNWWGNNSGPHHTTLNPTGTGDNVSDYVLITPWTVRFPPVVAAPPAPKPKLTINFLETEDTVQIDDEGTVQAEYSASTSNGNLKLTVPAGTKALDANGDPITGMTVVPLDEDIPLPQKANIIGIVYDFGPSGATFYPPLVITMTYDPDNLPEGNTPADLFIAWYDAVSGEWIELETTVDTETNTLTAHVPHFTNFAVLGKIAEPEPVIEPETGPEPDQELETEPVIEPEPEVVVEPESEPEIEEPVKPEIVEPEPVPENEDDEGGLPAWAVLLIVVGSLAAAGGLACFGKILYKRVMYN